MSLSVRSNTCIAISVSELFPQSTHPPDLTKIPSRSARPDDDDLVVTVEDKSTTCEKSSTPIATPTRIPVSASRRQPLGTPTSEQRLRMTGQQKARRSQFSESLDDTVRRVADEVLERSPVSQLYLLRKECANSDKLAIRRNSAFSLTGR